MDVFVCYSFGRWSVYRGDDLVATIDMPEAGIGQPWSVQAYHLAWEAARALGGAPEAIEADASGHSLYVGVRATHGGRRKGAGRKRSNIPLANMYAPGYAPQHGHANHKA